MKILTISQLQRIISERKCSENTGQDIYLVDDVKGLIVGRLEFKIPEVEKLVTKKEYVYIKK